MCNRAQACSLLSRTFIDTLLVLTWERYTWAFVPEPQFGAARATEGASSPRQDLPRSRQLSSREQLTHRGRRQE
uniref:Secreted protein n=1 Tax=Strigops habroptila TaxID=2489341 RepID=A0A672TGQ0_STRHB